MSKWNVRTTQGIVAADAALKGAPAAGKGKGGAAAGAGAGAAAAPNDAESGLVASNPQFEAAPVTPPVNAIVHADGSVTQLRTGGGVMHNMEFGSVCENRTFVKRISCVLVSIVTLALVIGLLYPTQPQVFVDRNATLQGLRYRAPDSSGIGYVYGNMTMVVQSKTVYDVTVEWMNITGIMGPTGAQMPWNAAVGKLFLPGNARSRFVLPFEQALPVDFPYATFGTWIVRQCLTNGGTMTMKMAFEIQIAALGVNLRLSQPLSDQQAPCYS